MTGPARVVPGALRVRLADGHTVPADELAAALAGLLDALEAVDGATGERAVGMLWQLAADARDVVGVVRSLGVLEGRHA